MKYFTTIFLFVISATGFAQDGKTAEYYYEAGLQKESDVNLKKKGLSPSKESLVYYIKASQLAEEGSELQLKAVFKTVYLYNYAETDQKVLITRRTIKGLRYLRNRNSKDLFAADYFFRAGLALMRDYKPDSAIAVFNEAIGVYKTLRGDNSFNISDCYHGIGDVYKGVLYDFNSAESFYEKALVTREQAGDDFLNLFMISKLHSELASVNRSQHDYEKALAYSLKHIAFAEKLSNEFHVNLELAYTNAADIYSEMDLFDEAEELYMKAIVSNKKINNNKLDPFLGDYYFGLADVIQKAGRIEHAIQFYLKGISVFESASGYKDVLHIKCYQRLAEAYLSRSDMKQSRTSFFKAIALLDKFDLRKSGQASELYRLVGNYFITNQDLDSALVYYQYALQAASKDFTSRKWINNPQRKAIQLGDFAYEALLSKSTALSQAYRKTDDARFANAALASFDLAEKLLIDSRAKLDMDNAKWIFFDSNFGLYQQVLSLIYKMESAHHSDSLIQKAFYYMESSKSKMLADALNEAEVAAPLLASDSLVQYLDLQKRNLYQLQDELKKREGDRDKQSEIRNSIILIDRNIQRAENEIGIHYPVYLKTKYRHDIPDLGKIQKLSKEKKAAVIEFFWGTDEVFALIIQGGNVFFRKLGATDFIQTKVVEIRNFLSSDDYNYSPAMVTSFEKNAIDLYELLLAPFTTTIEEVKRLIILPDGLIEQIPFEILVSKPVRSSDRNFATLHYLVKEYSISYSFSSSYLLNQSMEKLANPRMLAFGYTEGNKVRSLSDGPVKSSLHLPGSESELKAISKQFPEGEYHFGSDVTEGQFKQKAPFFDLIHLAVHGSGNTEQQYSASLFFRDMASSKEDGQLYWYELFGLRLKAKLAVISSCESGIGKTYRGEGMLSMASAFAFAGCKNVVMGLWKIDDRVSSDLMSVFYENLQAGDYVDVALTKAKRSYLAQGDNLTANPKLWGSLISYGNEEVIDEENNIVYWILSFALLLICLAILIKIKKGNSSLVR